MNLKYALIKACIPIFLIYNALVYIAGFSETIRIIIAIIIGLIGYILCFDSIYINYKVLIFIALTIITGLCSLIYNSNMSIGNFVSTLFYIGMSLIMLKYKMNFNLVKALFYGLSIFFIFKIVSGIESNEVLYYVSRNYISVLMLTSTSLLYIGENDKKNKNISLIPAIIFLIISIWGFGRGGIITSGLFFIGIITIKIFTINSKYEKRILYIILGSFLVLFLAFCFDFEYMMGKYFISFDTKGIETPRTVIYQEYFNVSMQSFSNFIFGPSIEDMYIANIYSGNLHNSFIQMHAYYGILFSSMIILLLFNSILFFIKKKDYVKIILISSLIIRAFTDRLFFSGYSEILLYYYLLFPLVKGNNKSLGRKL